MVWPLSLPRCISIWERLATEALIEVYNILEAPSIIQTETIVCVCYDSMYCVEYSAPTHAHEHTHSTWIMRLHVEWRVGKRHLRVYEVDSWTKPIDQIKLTIQTLHEHSDNVDCRCVATAQIHWRCRCDCVGGDGCVFYVLSWTYIQRRKTQWRTPRAISFRHLIHVYLFHFLSNDF